MKRTTIPDPVAQRPDDLVRRNFRPRAPDRLGVDLERLPEPDRVARLGGGGVRREGFAALAGEGVVARSE